MCDKLNDILYGYFEFHVRVMCLDMELGCCGKLTRICDNDAVDTFLLPGFCIYICMFLAHLRCLLLWI